MQFLSVAILFLASFGVALAQQPQQTPKKTSNTAERIGEVKSISPSDSQFVQDALKTGRQEVAMGQMALRQSSSSAVKEYAQRLINDHGTTNKKFEQFAKEYGISVPDSGPDKSIMARFTNLSGPTFDYEFAEQMVRDHDDAVARFESAQKSVMNPELRAVIESALPTLKEHLSQARTLH